MWVSSTCEYLSVKVTLDISGSPLNRLGLPGIPKVTGKCARGCVCACVCVCVCKQYEGVPIFCGISITITDTLLLIWSPGHLQLHCWPCSGGCNHLRWNETINEWFRIAKLVPVFYKHVDIYALSRHRKLGCSGLLKHFTVACYSKSLVWWIGAITLTH